MKSHKMQRFLLHNRDKGIPNLMLFLAAAKLIVFFVGLIDPSSALYNALYFSPYSIFHGQVWRLVTYILLPDSTNVLLFAISLFFYYYVGRVLEASMGRLRFNLFYLSNVLTLDALGLILGLLGRFVTYDGAWLYVPLTLVADFPLLFAFATVNPDSSILLMFIIPIKMKYFAWLETFYIVYYMIKLGMPLGLIAPLSLVPYFLFFGADARLLLPDALQGIRRKRKKSRPAKPDPKWAEKYRSKDGQRPYHHKCTVCGRTDTDYPDLEFRYCSRCKGYYCYCIDHINNHIHITDEP